MLQKIFFLVSLFGLVLFFSGCNIFDSDDSGSGRDQLQSVSTKTFKNIKWLPPYNSFETQKVYIPLTQVSQKQHEENFKDPLPENATSKKIPEYEYYEPKDGIFEGSVFVNTTKIFGNPSPSTDSVSNFPKYEILEKKYFSEKGPKEGAVLVDERFHMYFAKNILKEGDVLKIVPESAEAKKYNIQPITWTYEKLHFTNLSEIHPEISLDAENFILEFPFEMESSKLARVQNFFQIWDVNGSIIPSTGTYNIQKKTMQLRVKKSAIWKGGVGVSTRHYSEDATKNTTDLLRLEKLLSVQLGETFQKSKNFQSDIEIHFAGKLFEDLAKNDDRFLENRKQEKIKFLKNISIVPKITPALTPDNIFLTPQKAIITANLDPDTQYDIQFSDEIFPKINPEIKGMQREEKKEFFLNTTAFSTKGIEMQKKQTLFSARSLPEISVYAFPKPENSEKNTRKIIICKISPQEYGDFENALSYSSNFEEFYREKFVPEYSHPEYFHDKEICQVKTVDFSNPQNIQFTKDEVGAGIYFVSFISEKENAFTELPYLDNYQDRKEQALSTKELSREKQESWKKGEDEMNFIQDNILLFSIVDTHITYKYDMKDTDFFWVTDEKTGKDAEGVEIFIIKSKWERGEIIDGKRQKGKYVFSEISLGKTDSNGVLKKNRGGNQYEFGSDILRFVAKKDGKFSGIVSSSWNAGIAAWNFGMDNSGYGKASQKFLAHIVPDRKLYAPGEKMFIKAVIRKDGETLHIPDQQSEYTLKLRNPDYETIVTETVSPNKFGSVFFEYTFPQTAMRGNYQVVLSGVENENSENIENNERGNTFEIERVSVQLQDFILPTFEVNVGLEKSSIPVAGESCPFEKFGETCGNEEKISGDISLKYFSGGSMPEGKFTYKIYKKSHYDTSYWDYCYWGCYGSSSKNYVTSGTGEIKNGSGNFSFARPVLDELETQKYEYIAEVSVSDATGEKNTGSGTIIVDSEEFSEGKRNVKFQVQPEKNIFKKGEKVKITIQGNQNFLDYAEELNDQKQFFIVRREYATKYFKDVSGNMRAQNNFEDFTETEISLNTTNFIFDKKGRTQFVFTPKKTGEYRVFTKGYSMREYPDVQKIWVYPENSDTSEVMNMPVLDDVKINLIQEKHEYKIGETAKILVQSPFKKGTAFMTIEKDEVVSHQEIPLENNVTLLEIPVDEKFVPNAYVSVVVKNESGSEYRLGYAEIIVDQSEKKLDIDVQTNKKLYAPRETVVLEISGKNPAGNPEISEFSVAVIDESLISMIENIDMDILKTFYDKIPFSLGTAMTNVAMKKNMYFSRRGIIGGSGSKGGGSSTIFTRSLFKKTAFYKGDIVSDKNGNAEVKFELPDTIGQFRIVVLGNTKTNFFGAAEKVINVHQDVVIEEQFPLIFRRGDTITLEANVFNNSKEYGEFSVDFTAEKLKIFNNIQKIKIPAGERKKVSWKVKVPENVSFDIQEIGYEISATSSVGNDKIQKKITLAKTPLLSQYEKEYFSLDSKKQEQEILLNAGEINTDLSTIEISVGNVPQLGIENILSSLAQYPHGCLEQTTSSTLPNALLLSFSKILEISDFDEEKKKQTQKNLEAGIKRIFSMQQPSGGFAYWQGETSVNNHYSPYAIWGLAKMKELGYLNTPNDQKKLDKAEEYLISVFTHFVPGNDQKKEISRETIHRFSRAELVESLRALAVLKSDFFLKATQIITTEKEHFSDHEKIMYALALLEYDTEKYRDASQWLISQVDLERTENSQNRFYYGKATDEVLLAQAWQYIDANSENSHKAIDTIKAYTFKSYFYSTATKNQSLLAFLQHLKAFKKLDTLENSEVEIVITSPKISDNGFTTTKKITLSSEYSHQKILLNYSDLFDPENKNADDSLFVAPVKISTTGNNPVFGMVVSQTTPKNKTDIKAEHSGWIQVKREIVKLTDVLSRDSGHRLSTVEYSRQALSGKNIGLRMGEKYQVRITVSSDKNLQDIAVESYLPSGVKVLNSAFKNNETVLDKKNSEYWNPWWTHKETKKDMVFASDSYFYDQKILEYTFVPTQEGEFYFPPVLAYAMYQPEIRANTAYQKISVGR